MKPSKTFNEALRTVLEMNPMEIEDTPVDSSIEDVFSTFERMTQVADAAGEKIHVEDSCADICKLRRR